jgi:serine protease
MESNTSLAPNRIFFILALLISCLLAFPVFSADIHEYPCEPDLIEIMFIQESQVRLTGPVPEDFSGLNATDGVEMILMSHGGGEWLRLTDIPEPVLDEMALTAEMNLGEPVYNLNNIFRIRLLGGADVVAVAYDLENLPGVHLAYPVPLPVELPLATDYTPNQNYLDPAVSTPTGVDARYAWTQTGGTGTGVTICDLEYSWNYNHTDVTKALGSQINTNISDPMSSTDHGTSVIGELVSDANGWGTTGVAHGATLKTCGTYYGLPSPTWNIVGAMALTITNLAAGDVMLLEQQWPLVRQPVDSQFVPVEWLPHTSGQAQSLTAVYAAIQNAVGNGISVVEAGGNGGVNTDLLTWYGDSGAVIVGAGGAYTGGTYPNGDLQRLGYSSYGSRFDLQAWGENVWTTGKGDYYSAEGANVYFTNNFTGTSSASPIVAGAIACLNGYYAANVSTTPMTPAAIRANLVATGTAQINPPAGSIGPRPDLYAAIQALPQPPANWTDVTSGPLGNTGFGKSVAWCDMDNDGDDDLYITNSQSQNHVFRNDGSGNFTDVTTPVEGNFMFAGAAEWGDWDNDGLPDLYVGNWAAPNKLYVNSGMGFLDMTTFPLDDFQDGSGVAWVDINNDGMLDIHVSNMMGGMDKLFLNMGGGMHIDFTNPPMDNMLDSHDAAWSDMDRDGDMDCYIVNMNGPNDLMINDGQGNFQPFNDPVLMDPGVGTGACWGDMDGDGDQDLYLTNQGGPNQLYRNDGLFFTDVTNGPLGNPGLTMSASWGDYDNDGDLDLYMTSLTTGGNKLLRNDGNYIFTDDTNGPLAGLGGGHGAAWSDYDNDGDLDIYAMFAGGANKLFRNDNNTNGNYLQMQLHGSVCNASAIGAKVRVVAGGQSYYRELGTAAGYCSQNSSRMHFGLGSATWVDSLIIDWPGNSKAAMAREVFTGLAANQMLVIQQDPLSDAHDQITPLVCRLHRGVPNPFNPQTTISFELSKTGPVSLKIYNIAGQCLRTLVNGERGAGINSVVWMGKNDQGQTLPSGVYFARMVAEGKTETTKLLMTK